MSNHDSRNLPDHSPGGTRPFTPADLAALGTGVIAYVRPISAEAVLQLVPDAVDIPHDVALFALIAANGQPIMITDSQADIAAGAHSNQLMTVSVH